MKNDNKRFKRLEGKRLGGQGKEKRYFLSQGDMAEARRYFTKVRARINREKTDEVVAQFICSCGCGVITGATDRKSAPSDFQRKQRNRPNWWDRYGEPTENYKTFLNRQPKGQRKPNIRSEKQCIHFKGKAIQ